MSEVLNKETERDEVDLGNGHRIIFTQYKGEKRVGADLIHPPVEDKCGGVGWIAFEGRSWANSFKGVIATWNIETEEPITISPSILCRSCGDHGFVRNGKWVIA